jgi:DNA polymerase (family 10)
MSKKKATAKANFEKTSRKDALVVGAKLSQALWPLCKVVTIVGSIRQGKGMIGDIDIVVIPSIEPGEFLEQCKSIIEYEYGGKKKIFGMFMGRPINIFVTDESGYGACTYQMTGPVKYNILMRRRAKLKGFRLNEYGLYNRESGEYIAGQTERSIFEAMELQYKAPIERK